MRRVLRVTRLAWLSLAWLSHSVPYAGCVPRPSKVSHGSSPIWISRKVEPTGDDALLLGGRGDAPMEEGPVGGPHDS